MASKVYRIDGNNWVKTDNPQGHSRSSELENKSTTVGLLVINQSNLLRVSTHSPIREYTLEYIVHLINATEMVREFRDYEEICRSMFLPNAYFTLKMIPGTDSYPAVWPLLIYGEKGNYHYRYFATEEARRTVCTQDCSALLNINLLIDYLNSSFTSFLSPLNSTEYWPFEVQFEKMRTVYCIGLKNGNCAYFDSKQMRSQYIAEHLFEYTNVTSVHSTTQDVENSIGRDIKKLGKLTVGDSEYRVIEWIECRTGEQSIATPACIIVLKNEVLYFKSAIELNEYKGSKLKAYHNIKKILNCLKDHKVYSYITKRDDFWYQPPKKGKLAVVFYKIPPHLKAYFIVQKLAVPGELAIRSLFNNVAPRTVSVNST